ncbi:magnesium-translocating P-type ATPase [Glaciimonas sp. CA11.2]|uniref:magnesium-translocating P-type ATPase n=1 Tax=unclassified Glaciimonas TaxID=2644401 RepID=UPI002AB5AA35|nr:MULTISPECIES: magnesium-translocating P-type ATPase [unclassified Glaciimonas]MDY7546797.1 magnesium-translocating P-type ATPase [Glaciimonas sp. CA11.2]MEB0012264.1 magnesium-translocating P-type ATPase [Glaciimonas sp. Cout2]MEB0080548.1 magnesium-translocating P-type ATPase [Glaciimonas sp. Gout2]MEB0162679.1 magnesium-translocating P-type ATPase [Glaciimonas sp. CA11.2]
MNLNLLKDSFVRFVHAHGMDRHFRRFSSDMFSSTPTPNEVPPTLAQHLLKAARADLPSLLEQLKSRTDGLTDSEADAIRLVVGPNEVEHEKPLPWWAHLWQCYKNPFNLLLTVLAAVSFATEDMKATVVIGTMVVLSTLMRFVQESRSNSAADKLKEMVSNTATVLRHDLVSDIADEALRYFDVTLHPKGARRIELAIKKLVPGDIVQLSAGDMIPADLRLLTAKDLFISQAAMTGESLPVEKFLQHRGEATNNPLELDNLCFMGTNVISGSATAIVVTTGNQTYFGALAERVTATDRTPTAFQLGVNKVSWLLIRFMMVMTPIVFFLNGFTKGDWVEAFLFGLSVAVGLTPEMLPMIVTSTLAKGAVALSRKKVIVKRLDAIQNFGAMDVLCTDKTGTLTQDKIFLERHTDILGKQDDLVLEYAYLNSHYQTGLKNLLDVAVLDHAELQREMALASAYRKVDEIPFDFQRRRMSVVVSEREDHHELICKGAVEEIVSICTHARHNGTVVPFSAELLKEIHETTASLNAEGLRVVAVAAKDLPPTKEVYGVADESDLVLIGYIAFLDPPKESTKPALDALKKHGVTVKILTGDNQLVTAKICRQVGLTVDGMLLGSDVEDMSDADLAIAVEKTTVFAKLSPTHKERIVRRLHDNGHVVGFMGDGINDAPALRAADIGISVDTAVDIAKEAADIILLEKSLMVLEEGVLEGRKTFANMLKYIKMTASSNFGNVFSVLVASAFLPFLPMLPLHLLVQNLLYDISQITIPFDNVDKEFLEKPQRWDPKEIGRFMIFFGPISSIFDIATFALLWYVFGANTNEHQTLFQSGWFIEGLLSQTLIVHMIRTRKIPFFQSRASWALISMTVIIMAIGILLPMSPLAHYFKLQALPLSYFPWLLLILGAYAVLTQMMKGWYAKRYGWQ